MNDYIKTSKLASDAEIENTLRPSALDEYIGQDKVKEGLKIYMQAAKDRGEPLDHVLLYGPPGLGKTTLSHIIATEMGSQLKVTSGPAIEHAADLAAILTNLQKNDVLFIDELHRLHHSVEEILYPAMEDFSLDFIVGKGPSARNMRLKLQPFTLVGATTKAGAISAPLRDRFGIIHRLELYGEKELTQIIERSSKILKVNIDSDAVTEIAMRSRGTPRIANRLLKRVRDYAQVKNGGVVNLATAKEALKLMDVDDKGLDFVDRRLLESLINTFKGGPVGVETLATAIGEEMSTVEDVYEPYLIRLGYIARTPRGRVALEGAYEHLGLKYDDFEFYGKQLNIPPTCASRSIFEGAKQILESTPANPVRLISIGTTKMSTSPEVQLSMFGNDFTKDTELSKSIDKIKKKYGYSSIQPASTLANSDLCERIKNSDYKPFKN